MKRVKLYEQFINEERPEWHDSDAPDAEGRFKDLNPKDLAAWLIKTRKKDLRKITGSLNQQIVFNRGEDKAYADKMEKTRKEVYKQLGREDLLEAYNINKYSPNSYAERVASGAMSFEDAQEESGLPFTLLMKLVKKIDKNFKLSFESEDRDWNDKRKGPHPYTASLSDKDEEEKEDQMKKQTEMDDDDPKAYKEMPGDEKAREEGKVKTSKHVKKYHELYGDEKNESLVIEKAEGNRGPIDDDAIETGLKNKSEETGVPIGLLRIVMRRGMAAWKTGHRPGATEQQWGYARVNSFLTKSEGTWGGADSDVAKEVRDGGHDKKLKS